MEFLWSPWRYDYLASKASKASKDENQGQSRRCVFCIGEDSKQVAGRLIVYRGAHNFVILNLFPYTS